LLYTTKHETTDAGALSTVSLRPPGCPPGCRAIPDFRDRLDGAVAPREGHGLSDGVLIGRVQPNGRASLTSPRAALGGERGRMLSHERFLLLWCEFNHPALAIAM